MKRSGFHTTDSTKERPVLSGACTCQSLRDLQAGLWPFRWPLDHRHLTYGLTNSGRTQPEVFSGCDEENCFVVAQTHFWPRHRLSTAKADDCSRVDDLTRFPSSSIGSSKSLYSCQTCSPLVRCSADPSSPRQRSNFI